MANHTTPYGTVSAVNGEQCPNAEQLSTNSPFFVASLVFVSTVNLLLLFAAVVGNAMIVLAHRGVTSIHPSSRTLFYSLAASDLCVGFIVQPFNLIYLTSTVTGNAALCLSTLPYFDIFGFVMCGVSLLTTAEISVDRLLALRLKLRYRRVVSLRRTRAVVIVTWLVSLTAGLTSLWSRVAFNILQIIGVFLSITVSSFSNGWIQVILRQHGKRPKPQRQTAWDEPSQSFSFGGSFNSVRFKKTVSTALSVYCALMLCFLPYMIASALWAIYGGNEVVLICHAFALTLLYFNSAFNPVRYCWKIREVRNGVKGILNHMKCK